MRTSNSFSEVIDTMYANQAKLEYLVLNLYQHLGVPIPAEEEEQPAQSEPQAVSEGPSQSA